LEESVILAVASFVTAHVHPVAILGIQLGLLAAAYHLLVWLSGGKN